MTQHFIVIGNPISHSRSPDIHHNFAQQVGLDIEYSRQLCPDNDESFHAVVEAFFNGGGRGANVTVPFKQTAYRLCHKLGQLSDHAAVAGAVNTLMMRDGQLYGDNTDGQGLVNHITAMGWPLDKASRTNIAIIGAGGAARGVILPLLEAGVGTITIANRTVSKAQDIVTTLQESDQLKHLASQSLKSIPTKHHTDTAPPQNVLMVSDIDNLTGHFDIIINATSIALTGSTLPLSPELTCAYAYDMMYGRQLPFLKHFAAKESTTSDGYGMLISQAALSFGLWTNETVSIEY